MSIDLIWRAIANNVMLVIIDAKLVGLSAALTSLLRDFIAIGTNPSLQLRLKFLLLKLKLLLV